jgi:AcrR family transcriptional regulator
MDHSFSSIAGSIPPLPQPLAAVLRAAATMGPKRERTQAQLVLAAAQVFSARGVAAATMQEVAQAAGVAPGTVYNHFATKEELVQRLATVLAESLCRAISQSYEHISDGAERMAIGQRRYVGLAQESPAWALLLLDVMAVSPAVLQSLQRYPLADLRLGVRQRKFRVPSEAAAMDVVNGVCTHAMRRAARGEAPARHDVATATLVLRALGMPPEEAAEVARRPLPPLQLAAPPPARKASR